MAVTKIKAIRGTLSKAIAYILNPEKTDEKLLVSSYGCASETAAREFEWTRKIAEQKGMNPVRIIARHVIQSFEIGEVTPELAHEIGKQFADEILGGKYEYVLTTHIDKDHVHNHLIFNAVDFVDYHAYKSYKRIYYDMREVSDRLCKENGLSVIPPSQNKGMSYKEYTEAKRGTSWKQKLKQTIDRLVITAKDYDDFLRLMQEAGYEIKPGKYISFRAEGQERFTRSKTIGENYTEERIKERIAGRTPRKSQRQTTPKGISLIGDIQERIRLIDSKGYEHKAKLTILKEAARTLNYLTENNLLQYADLEKKVEDVHISYDRTGKELKAVEARLREVQPLIKNISNYQRLKPVYDAFQKAKDKPSFKTKHEAELVIFEATRSTLLAMQGDEKLPSLKTLQAEQQRLLEEQQRLYDERAKLKKEEKKIETIKSNVDTFLAPSADHDRDHLRSTQRE
ncbi:MULTISPECIES: relaxase/mobilization nuclease domain-containing protein [Clostridia]|uniref:relaxase/mobilization nuclease domain-containing protein n=1 Tax=Clostridia TaxID=186801 RepID=UPI0008F806A2|nr:relaxase/mobilization nuclease domain-containing protein [Angelakisella massiliensis]